MIITLNTPPPLYIIIPHFLNPRLNRWWCVWGWVCVWWGWESNIIYMFSFQMWLQLFISANNLCRVISSISSKIQTRVSNFQSNRPRQSVQRHWDFLKWSVTIVPPFPDHSTSPVLALGNFLFFCETHVSVGKFIRWNYWKIDKWTLSVLCLSPYHPFLKFLFMHLICNDRYLHCFKV